MSHCYRFTVRGQVQGVGFRAAAQRQAVALHVNGWVRNRHDGSVEGLACGDAEALQRFHDWLKVGPPLAQVSGLEWRVTVSTPEHRFDILQ